MPDLLHSLQGRDLGHLRIIAQLWGIELTAQEVTAACEELARSILDSALIAEVVETLPAEARAALEALAAQDGRMPWAAFVRHFGEVREIGPGRRDREQPHLNPISAAEILFYRALLARAFFDTPSGPQEFAYIPDDLLAVLFHREEGKEEKKEISALSAVSAVSNEPLGRPATPGERAHVILASDRILDDACTLLAALRLGIEPPKLEVPTDVLIDLLVCNGLICGSPSTLDPTPRSPLPEPGRGARGNRCGYSLPPNTVKAFLEAPRGEALAQLVRAWLGSETFNELRQLPDLICEGEWRNDPLAARRAVLGFLQSVPRGKWWKLSAFVQAVCQKHPDFQRPAGDYDSWFIRREADGVYLRGFDHWDEVDGALIRYFITGPLHWLGIIDLAAPAPEALPAAFRWSVRAEALLKGEILANPPIEDGRLHAASNGRISVPRLLPRAARYQIARFCEWEAEATDEYRYRVTPVSLSRAREQGLRVDHLLAILRKHAAASLPPPFVRALQRWESNGTEARLENLVVLRLCSPEVLKALRKSKAARFLGEPLGPTAVIVKAGAQAKVLQALAEMGLLAEYGNSEISEA